MAYGTDDGVKNLIKDYSAVSDFTAPYLAECRTKADSYINMKLAPIVNEADIPLVSPPAVVGTISDMFTAYFVLYRMYLKREKSDSPFVSELWDKADKMLDFLLENPAILTTAIAQAKIDSTTLDQDRIFSVERTSEGETVSGDYEGTMEDW